MHFLIKFRDLYAPFQKNGDGSRNLDTDDFISSKVNPNVIMCSIFPHQK